MFKEIKASDIKENICDLLKNNWGLVTAGNSDKFNTMTVSWGSMGELWGKDSVTVYIRPQRYTEEFMNSNDHFTLSFTRLIKSRLFTEFAAQRAAGMLIRLRNVILHLILMKMLRILKKHSLCLFAKKWQKASSTQKISQMLQLTADGILKKIIIIFILQR